MVLEIRSQKISLTGLKSRCQQDCIPSRGSREFVSLSFPFQELSTFLALWSLSVLKARNHLSDFSFPHPIPLTDSVASSFTNKVKIFVITLSLFG